MESQFEFEAAIRRWRQALKKRRMSATTIRELEGHLREAYAQAVASGQNPVTAWDDAQAELGTPDELAEEFAKLETSPKRRRVVLSCCFLVITFFHLFGVVSSQFVPFTNDPMPFSQAIGHIDWKDVFGVEIPWLHAGFFVALLGLASIYLTANSTSVRVATGVAAILVPAIPFLFLPGMREGWEGFLVPFVVAIHSPLFTLEMFLGRVDGEFFADGVVVFISSGWWVLLWLGLLGREAWFSFKRRLWNIATPKVAS